MTPAVALILLWFAVATQSAIAVDLQLFRHGARGLAVALLCPIGAVAFFGFVSAAIGVAEGAWGVQSVGMWIALAIGTAGIAMTIIGWRSVLRPRRRAGQCPACGYELAGVAGLPRVRSSGYSQLPH